MSDLWVAVTAEYQGHPFSHRSTYLNKVPRQHAVHAFNVELDNAASMVRHGIANWVPQQWKVKPGHLLSDYEKIEAIREVLEHGNSIDPDEDLAAIESILDQ